MTIKDFTVGQTVYILGDGQNRNGNRFLITRIQKYRVKNWLGKEIGAPSTREG